MGENAGLECKTTFSLDLKQFNGVEFPVQYYAQCVHYLAVTGADRWYLAVLAYGGGVFTFVLERDQAEIDNAPDQPSAMPGDIRYRDVNRDGIIDTEDAVHIGFPETPRIIYGFSGFINYKNWEFNFSF